MNYLYSGDMPYFIQEKIAEIFDPYVSIWPSWVSDVTFSYSSDGSKEAALACNADYRYRRVEIVVYTAFFNEIDLQEIIFHELYHVLFSPYTILVESLFNNYIKDEDAINFIVDQLSIAEEGMAQDFAILTSRLTRLKNDVIIPDNEEKV